MTPAKSGAKLAETLGCVSCHKDDGNGRGPSLLGVYNTPQKLTNGQTVTADDAYIRESILNPRAKVLAGYETLMATYQGQVSEEQILDIIAYIRSLSTAEALKQQQQGTASPTATGATPAATSATPAAPSAAPAATPSAPAAKAPVKPAAKPATK
jgi:cytochrome c oxidase subunit 2